MRRWGWSIAFVIGLAGLFLAGCVSPMQPNEPVRTIQIDQTWQLQPGDQIGNYRIAAGLGDISIELAGGKVYAPFEGRIQLNVPDCVLFSSPELPAYLFRLCGLQRPRLGAVKQGQAIGNGQYLHFATLRKLPEGTWTIVEPSRSILERLLKPS